MKIAKTLTFEANTFMRFTEAIGKRPFGETIESLMREYVRDKQIENIKLVTCDKCGAKYSEKLPKCPSCEVSEVEEAKQKRLEEESKDRELTEKEQKILNLETEIESYENTLERLNDPEGTSLPEEEKEAHRARLNATIVELRAALEEAKK